MTGLTRTRAAGAGLIALVAGFGQLLGAAPAAGAQVGPPGNNGTVKVDDLPFDDHPDNEPHDGCVFQVDFYNYDEGDLSATVTFEAHPGTIDETADTQELLTDELDIGEDPNGGGTDLDASGTYDLTNALVTIEPHAQQGWHVKLTVHAEGSKGADVKHKVFWVSGCETPGSTTSSTPTTKPHGPTTTDEGTTTTKPGHKPTSTTQPDSTTTSVGSPAVEDTPTSVAGAAQVEETTTTTGTLPNTGSNATGPLAALGLVLVGVGASVLGMLRLRRTT